MNAATVFARNIARQDACNATVTTILAPRIVRFGLKSILNGEA